MSSPIVPREVDFSKPVSLPASTKCSSLVASPQGGLNAVPSSQINFSLVHYGYLVPDSMYLSCTLKFTNGATGTANVILGVPALAWINSVNCFVNSTNIENINSVGALSQMLLSSKMNAADKHGMSLPLGYNFNGDGVFVNEESDGFTIVAATATSAVVPLQIATPFPNIFSNCEKYFPLSCGECRIQITSDQLSAFATTAAGTATTLTGYTIENIQLFYDIIEFDQVTDSIIKSQVDENGDMYLKSESWALSSATIATGFQGYVEIPYANSLTSIKSIYALFSRADRYKYFAAYDPTQGNGYVQFTVGAQNYPQNPIDTLLRRPTAVIEHLEAVHGTKISPITARTCLTSANFRDSTVAQGSDAIGNLSKAFFGTSLEKISGSYLLTGISSMNSNVTVRCAINTVTNVQLNALLILNHDCLIKINPSTRQVNVLR